MIRSKRFTFFFVLAVVHTASCFVVLPLSTFQTASVQHLFQSADDESKPTEEERPSEEEKTNDLNDTISRIQEEGPPIVQTSNVRIDDGGSDLTDRFKFKDPADSNADNERENGNILNAMVRFPVEYTFHVVGKTSGDDNIEKLFVEQVKDIVQTTSGADNVVCRTTPRGTKFTKVSIQVLVDNARIVNSVYDQLGEMELYQSTCIVASFEKRSF